MTTPTNTARSEASHLLTEQAESNEIALISEVTTAKKSLTTLKMG